MNPGFRNFGKPPWKTNVITYPQPGIKTPDWAQITVSRGGRVIDRFPGGMEIVRTRPRPVWKEPWRPAPPNQRQLDIGARIAQRRAQDQAARMAEEGRRRERALQEARERQRQAEQARQREAQARQARERVQQQERENRQRLREQQNRLAEQRERERQRRQEQLRQMERTSANRGSTFMGDFLAGMAPPRFRFYALRRPILGSPFARTGLEALSNLKQREAFAGRFAFENVAFWSTQIAQVVGGLIGGVGQLGAVGSMLRQFSRVPLAMRLPATSIVEIGAGDLNASMQLQSMGARVIAVEPDAAAIPAGALRQFQAMGGEWLGTNRTAGDLASKSADHVVQYFPWEIGGSGRFVHGGTWDAAEQGIRIARKTVTFVTDDAGTASYLAEQALRQPGVDKVAWIKSTAGQAAPGATGTGLPGVPPGGRVSAGHPVDMVLVTLSD